MSRRAFTLTETLVVLTVGSVMLGVAVGMLHLLLRSERVGRDRAHRAAVSARLAEQFRDDAAAALRQAPVEDDPAALCRFILPENHAVTYRALADEVRREERVADKPVRREFYALPDGGSVAVAVDADSTLLNLVVACKNTLSSAGRQMRVTAPVGKDRRFTENPKEEP